MAGFNNFSKIADSLKPVASAVVRKTAFDIQAGYQARVPRDTSFAANSAYVVTSKESTYGQGGGPSKPGSYLLPEVSKPDDETTAYAAVGANYAIHLEMGTVHMPARPAFYPAVEEAKVGFNAAMGKIREKMEEAGK